MSKTSGTYLNYLKRILSWLKTSNHKHIGFLYFIAIISFFVLGIVHSFPIRFELPRYSNQNTGDFYNGMVFYYGIVMMIATIIPGVFGNFILPTMIGAKNVKFPKLNLLSWSLFTVGSTALILTLFTQNSDNGSTFYTPYSSAETEMKMFSVVFGMFTIGFSSLLNSLNFIATFHIFKTPKAGMGKIYWRIWTLYLSVILQVLAILALAIPISFFISERNSGVGIFDPRLGGNPILFQHTFTFQFSPLILYAMILPSACLVFELVVTYSRKLIFSYLAIAYSFLTIAGSLIFVWFRYTLVSDKSDFISILFSLTIMLAGIAIAIKLFSSVASLRKRNIKLDSSILFANGFVFLCGIGGLAEAYIYFASINTDLHFHDTYFVGTQSLYIVVGGTLTALMGTLIYSFSTITGKIYEDLFGKISWLFILSGFHVIFFSQFILGNVGNSNKYYDYLPRIMELNQLPTYGFWLVGIGLLVGLIGVIHALVAGKQAESIR